MFTSLLDEAGPELKAELVLVAALSYNALCFQVSCVFKMLTFIDILPHKSQVTEHDVSLWTQKPHGETSVLSHIFSANAECQAIICSETVS